MDRILTIDEIKACVEQVAKQYDIKRVSLFGSYASGNVTKDSDIDLLVEFGPSPITLYDMAGIKLKIEELAGKSVDLVETPLVPGALVIIEKEVSLYVDKRRKHA